MITVYGRNTSSNVQLAMWTIGELGLDHGRIDCGGAFGGLDTPEFRAMNPNGLIPVMKDGDLVLWESNAIVRYLAGRYGGGAFWPDEPGRRAETDMWLEWSKTTLAPVINGGLFWTLIRTPKAERDMGKFAQSQATAERLLGIMEARLESRDFMMGMDLTAADIGCAHILYRYFTLDFERPSLPNVSAFYQRMTERPAFATHVMVSYEPLRVE